MYALDALFGLPRKRAAGVSHRPALHGNLFFCNQESVDEFVTKENDMKQSFQVVTLHFIHVHSHMHVYLPIGLQ